jgi:hypothetical protein
MWRELGEWGAREMALATPNPGTKATQFAQTNRKEPWL